MYQAKIKYIKSLFLDYSTDPFNQDGQAADHRVLGYKKPRLRGTELMFG